MFHDKKQIYIWNGKPLRASHVLDLFWLPVSCAQSLFDFCFAPDNPVVRCVKLSLFIHKTKLGQRILHFTYLWNNYNKQLSQDQHMPPGVPLTLNITIWSIFFRSNIGQGYPRSNFSKMFLKHTYKLNKNHLHQLGLELSCYKAISPTFDLEIF